MKSSSAASIRKAQEELERCLSVLSVGHSIYRRSPSLSVGLQLTHRYKLRLQLRNVTAVAQLGECGHQDLESAVSAAVKRHHEEEIELIKGSLAKTVRVPTSDPRKIF